MSNIVDDLWVSNDKTTIFRPMKLDLPQSADLNSFLLKGLEPIEIKTSAKVPCIPVESFSCSADLIEKIVSDHESGEHYFGFQKHPPGKGIIFHRP